MQPPQSQHSNVLISLVGIANQEPSQASSQKLFCSKCRFITKDHDLFERHLAQHAGVTFTCNICGHISYTKVESQRHAVQHSGKFPFKCEFCSYGAVRRDYVVKHVQRVHSRKRPGSYQDGRPNVLIMGDVSLASVPKVGLPTLINVTEQVTKAAPRPFDVVPNWIPLTVNQPQINATSHLSSMLNKPVGVTSDRHLSPQTQFVGVASNTDSLGSTGAPSQLISLTQVRIPHAGNDTNGNSANNNLLAGRQPKPYTGLTNLNQVTSIAPDVLSIVPSQAIHMAMPSAQNTLNNSVRRTPPNILRKNQHRSVGLGSNATNRNLFVGNQPASSAGKVVTNLNQFVAANGVSVGPPCTPLNTLRKTQQSSTGIGSKQSYVSINGAISQACAGSSSSRIPMNMCQTILGHSKMTPVSSVQTTRPTVGVSNLQGKMINLASNGPLASAISSLGCLTSRSPSTVRQSLNSHNKTMESHFGSKETSLQSRVPVVSDINGELELTSPVQVELLEPLNQPINHNRTLTVSFPEEVSIPPGSLVELVEVKTVNGAQEMQFRIVPQQSVGSSNKSTTNIATAVGASAVGSSMGRVLSGDKWLSKMGTDLCQTPSTSKASLLRTSTAPTTSLRTHTEGRVKVKEEPVEHDCFHTPLTQDPRKNLSVTNPGKLTSSLSTTVLTERKKDQSGLSHSVSIPLNKLPVTSSNAAVSGGLDKNSKLSEAQVDKHGDSNGDMETEGLPVILSVYSLEYSPDGECFPHAVEKSLPCAVGENNHETSTSVEDFVDNLLIPRRSSVAETLSQYLRQEGDYVMPPGKKRAVDRPEKEKNRDVQASTLNTQSETLSLEPATPAALVKSSQTDAPSSSADCQSNPRVASTECKPEEMHPPQQQTQKSHSDSEAMRRTNFNVQVSALEERSYEQLFILLPRVSLVRLSRKHLPPSGRTLEKHTENVSLTARPVLSCASNDQNFSVHQQPCHEVLKLRLKRKKCESDNESSDIFEALPTPETNLEAFSFPEEKRHKITLAVKRQRSNDIVISQKLCLTPAREDQLVKFPGPNQPVVVLNHPHPRTVRLDHSHQSPAHSRGIAPLRIVLSRDTHKIVPEIVKSPSLKMKFKKVQGNQYQVTELLAEGISDKLVL